MKEITREQFLQALVLSQDLAPKVLPPSWSQVRIEQSSPFFGQQLFLRRDGLKVIFTADRYWGKTWLHVSMSRQKRLPSYEDMTDVKALFIGRDRQALQIFPPASKHVNIHNYCLHLWCALEGDGLPDFGQDGTI